ncbi:MAG: hypothetical protein ABSG22_06645 [Sedimentisphaerales bacterium]
MRRCRRNAKRPGTGHEIKAGHKKNDSLKECKSASSSFPVAQMIWVAG